MFDVEEIGETGFQGFPRFGDWLQPHSRELSGEELGPAVAERPILIAIVGD